MGNLDNIDKIIDQKIDENLIKNKKIIRNIKILIIISICIGLCLLFYIVYITKQKKEIKRDICPFGTVYDDGYCRTTLPPPPPPAGY